MSTVLSDFADGVMTLTLNRPERRNAWNADMETSLRAALVAATDNPAVRVIVLTGAGKAFCAGADMSMLGKLQGSSAAPPDKGQHAAIDPWPDCRAEFRGKFAMPAAVPKPVIAAVNGHAIAVGCLLTLFCDIRFAAADAIFSAPFARMGLVAEKGIDWALAGLVGHGRAAEILLSGRRVDAVEAERIGLITGMFSADTLAASVQAYAAEMAATISPRSAAVIKRQLQGLRFDSPSRVFSRAEEALGASLNSPDFQETMTAMREKRSPRFPALPKPADWVTD